MGEVLRTPDERFADLPGWPYAPRHLDDLPGFEGLRLHHVDEGPRDAPFPDRRHKAGVRAFPNLVPDHGDAPGAAISRDALAFWKQRWAGDSFMAIGMQDPVLGAAAMRGVHAVIRGCPPPLEVADAGHFVQEWGEPVARAALAHFGLR